MTDDASKSLRFSQSRRLHGAAAFEAVYAAKTRRSAGPLTVCAGRNDLPHCRLGLSVSRRVGTAPTRNRIKRMIREAFRLEQHDLPPGYDLVVIARSSERTTLAAYRQKLVSAVRAIDASRRKRDE